MHCELQEWIKTLVCRKVSETEFTNERMTLYVEMLQPEDKIEMAQHAFGVRTIPKTEPKHETEDQE